MKKTSLALIIFIFTAPLFAATASKKTVSKTEPPTTPSAKLELAKSKNKVEFVVTGDLLTVPGRLSEEYKGAGPLIGELALKDGVLSGTATYELGAITTGVSMRDGHMKNKYLEVGKYPQAKLTIDPVKLPADKQSVPFTGQMQVKENSKPVTGTLTATKNGEDYDFHFKWDLKLSDFGIETPSFMEVTLTEKVSLDASITGKFL